MVKRWKTLERQVLLDRWWMTLREDRVELPGGTVVPEFHVIEYPDWALTVPLTSDGELVMVEQYRYGIDEIVLEFPAGAVEGDEPPERAAERELLEETGYAADEWTAIGSCAPEPSKHTNFAHIFLARGAEKIAEPNLDATENIVVHRRSIETVMQAARNGELKHGIHLTALFWAAQKGLI